MKHCTNCGRELHRGEEFCTECGERVTQENKPASRIGRGGASSNGKSKLLLGIVLLIGLFVAGAYYVMNIHGEEKAANVRETTKEQTNKDTENESSKMAGSATATEKPAAKQPNKDEQSSPPKPTEKAMTIETALNELNQLAIHAGSADISLGKWTIETINGTLLIKADNIPSENLQLIFSLYDSENLAPVNKWSVEVLHIVHELEKQLNLDWSLHVGNNCVGEYPLTLPDSLVMQYSGSCGYSIPVLQAYDWNDITLFIDEEIVSEYAVEEMPAVDGSSSFILPTSGAVKLHPSDLSWLTEEELRIARNEIFARHGYVFQSDDLQRYFSSLSWYIPDPYYDGSLSKVEEYNVQLIKEREDLYK